MVDIEGVEEVGAITVTRQAQCPFQSAQHQQRHADQRDQAKGPFATRGKCRNWFPAGCCRWVVLLFVLSGFPVGAAPFHTGNLDRATSFAMPMAPVSSNFQRS